jgi:hypothetical protein
MRFLATSHYFLRSRKPKVNKFKSLLICAIAVPVIASAADAPLAVDAPGNSCANIQWNPAFLKEMPKAAAACREVTVKDGVKFAKFNGKVSKVGKDFVEVEVSDVADIPISTIAFQTGVGGRITLNEKVIKVADLRLGDKLTFWVHEGQFGISPTLTDEPMSIIKPEAVGTS